MNYRTAASLDPLLLTIAAEVEAAVEAYRKVRMIANDEEWRSRFREMDVSVIFHLCGVLPSVIPIGYRPKFMTLIGKLQ
jgi:hypothetical protein